MTSEARVDSPSTLNSLAMIRTLAGIATISGFLVVMIYQLTLPMITENHRQAVERAVFKVVPGTTSKVDFALGPDGLIRLEDGRETYDVTIYAAFDQAGTLQGVAVEAAGRGYQDVIKILYGYSPSCECITGIDVIKMTETPGLGDKIATDPAFQANFKALDARLRKDGSALINRIVTVKHGTKTHPWQIDGITGATISAKAIGRMLNDSAQTLLPILVKALDKMRVQQDG